MVVIWTSFSSASILSCAWSSQSFLFFLKFKKVIDLLFLTILQLLSLLLSQSCAVQLQHHDAIYFVRLWDVHKQKYCHIKYTKHTVTILHVHWRHWGFLSNIDDCEVLLLSQRCAALWWFGISCIITQWFFYSWNLMISKTVEAKMNQTHFNWKDFCL